MNREQAEHILDAYTDMHRECGKEDACVESLREVILDAMTEYKVYTYPTITLPSTKPTTTWGPSKVTCTGIDPAFHETTHGTVYANGHVQEVGE